MSCSKKGKSNCVTIDCSNIECVNKKLIEGNDDCFTLDFTETIDDEIVEIILSDFDAIEMDIFDPIDVNMKIATKNLDDGLSIIGVNTLKIDFNGNEFIGLDYKELKYDILLIKDGIRKTYIKGSIFIENVGTRRIIIDEEIIDYNNDTDKIEDTILKWLTQIEEARDEANISASKANTSANTATNKAASIITTKNDVDIIKLQIDSIKEDIIIKASEISQDKIIIDGLKSDTEEASNIAITSSSVAITQANISTQKAEESLDNAEQTALDKIATGEDRVQTGLDRIQTGQDKIQTNLDRTSTGEDVIEVQQLVDNAQNILISVENIKDETETAADEITDNIDFTGLVEGDIIRHDGTKLVRMTEVEFLRRKSAHVQSPDGIWLPNPDFWEKDPMGTGLIAPSGQTYNTIDGFRTIPITSANNVSANLYIQLVQFKPVSGGDNLYFRAFVDIDNWFEISFSYRIVKVNEKIEGITTELFSGDALVTSSIRSSYRPMSINFFLGTYNPSKITSFSELIVTPELPATSIAANQFTSFGWSGVGLESIGIKAYSLNL